MVGSYSYFFLNCTGFEMIFCLVRRDKLFYCERLEPGDAARIRNKTAGKFAFAVCCRMDDVVAPTVGETFRTFWRDSRKPDTPLLEPGSVAIDGGAKSTVVVAAGGKGRRAQGSGFSEEKKTGGGGAGTPSTVAGDEDIVKDDPRNSKYLKQKFFSLCNAFCIFSGGGHEAIEMHEVHEKVFRSYEPRMKMLAPPY